MITYEIIKKFSNDNPNKIALKHQEKAITWVEYKILVEKIIYFLVENDLPKKRKSGPVLFLSRNSLDLVLLASAFASLKIPFQGLDYNHSADTVALLAKRTNSESIFVSENLNGKFSSLVKISKVFMIEKVVDKASRLGLVKNIDKIINGSVNNDSFKSYSFTSGTTGLPKVVYRTSSFDKRRFEYLINNYHFNEQDIYLSILPLYHVSTTGWLRLFLSLGCTVIVDNFETGYQLAQLLYANKVSSALLSNFMLKKLVDATDEAISKKYFKELMFVITGGKNISTTLKKSAINRLGHVVYEYYGTTETGVNTLLSPCEALSRPGSSGRVFEGNHIEIVDENFCVVPRGKIGRVAVHSYMNMDDYLHQRADFIEMGDKKFLVTADYGYLDANGYLYLSRRISGNNTAVMDFYSIENKILDLGYIDDVSINTVDLKEVNKRGESDYVKISLVPKKYLPFEKIITDVEGVSKKYGVLNPEIEILSELEYTPTGKINLSVNKTAQLRA